MGSRDYGGLMNPVPLIRRGGLVETAFCQEALADLQEIL